MPAAQTDTPAPTDAPAQTGMPAAQSITADDTEADDRAYDKQCFDARAVTTLDDRRIVGYFRPELVDRDKVLRELDAGNAAQQAFGIDAHAAYGKARTDIRDIKKRQAETLRSGALNLRTTIIFLGFGTIVVFFLNQLSQARQNSLIGCLLVLVIPGLACIAAFLPTRGIRERSRRPQMISLGVLALVFTVACIVFSHFAFRHPPNLIVMSVAGAVGILAGLLLASRKTSAECRALIKCKGATSGIRQCRTSPVAACHGRRCDVRCQRPCRRRGCNWGAGRGSCGPGHSAWSCGDRRAGRRSGHRAGQPRHPAWS